jgi:hypothetical protein
MIDLRNSCPRGVLVLQTVARRRGATFAVTEVCINARERS